MKVFKPLIRSAIYLGLICAVVFGGGASISAQKKLKNKRPVKKKIAANKAVNMNQINRERKRLIKIREARMEGEGDVEKRDDWFMFERTFPKGSIPPDARRNAWESRPAEASLTNLLGDTGWQPIGPHPTDSFFPNNWATTSGRINAVAVSPADPQLVLIGAAVGGVWRSTDGGASFSPVTDAQVDLAVGSIAFAPSNPSIVYAGMGDKGSTYLGSGVLKSTDGGQTWTRINNTSLPQPGRISKILVDPSDPNRVYVAQYAFQSGNSSFASGFFFSADGGVSWTKTLSGLPRDLVFHPTQPNILYMAVQRYDSGTPSTGGVFKSINSGQTWTRVHTSAYATTSNIKVAVTPAAPESVYVLSGTTAAPASARVEISTNGGDTWTNKGSNFDVGQLSYNLYIFVHPTDINTIYVGTRDLWRSTDGGTNYTNITRSFTLTGGYTPTQSKAHPDQHHFYISPTSPATMYVANDGGLWKTTDNLTTLQNMNASLSLTLFVSLAVHPEFNARTYGGTQDNGTQRRSSINGKRWKEFSTGDGGQTVIDPLDPSIVYTTYVQHYVDRFLSNGDNYAGEIGNPSIFASDRVAFYPPLAGNEVNSSLYFGTYRLYLSTNRGDNWTAPGGTFDQTFGGTDVLSAIAVAKSNLNTIYTGSSQGRAMISTDGGATWTQITNGLPARFIKSIIVSPTDPNTAFLTVSGFDSGHVFKTTNAGASWTNISGNLPNIPTNTILIDPRNAGTLWVGTDVGVYRSTVGGTTWESFNQGMPPAIVTELVAQSNGLIQAATYGRGAFQINPNPGQTPPFDFDGDGKTDIGIFRPAPAEWWYRQSSNGSTVAAQFGNSADKITPADWTGDGKADIALWRPSTGEWFILRSEDGSFLSFPFGTTGDIPATGDFDGDDKADAVIFRPSTATWYIQKSGGGTLIQQFGTADDKPTIADYDGDGKAEIAIYRPSVGEWWYQRSSDGQTVAAQFGNPTDKPVPGDWTGDGKADVAVYQPSSGYWFILRSENGSFYSFPFGTTGDVPAPGDYDGDGKFDAAVFRPGDSTWYIQRSVAGTQIVGFGLSSDKPIPNAYVP
jgi:photosystem II stability/assembly factor-like uncharacterized protein